MRLPSYLQKNQYGIYYFRIVFPKQIQLLLHRVEYKKSLRTSNRELAIKISRILKIRTEITFRKILSSQMDWSKTQKILEEIGKGILDSYREKISTYGVYPEITLDYPEKQAEADSLYYIQMKQFPLDHPNVSYSDEEIEKTFGVDSDAAKDLYWRKNGAKLSNIESINAFTKEIISKHDISISDVDYEIFCQKIAELLCITNKKRSNIINDLDPLKREIYHSPIPDGANSLAVNANNCIKTKKKLLDVFEDHLNFESKVQEGMNVNSSINYKNKFLLTYDILKFAMELSNYEDIYIEDVETGHVSIIKSIIEKLPKRVLEKFPNMKIAEICSLIVQRDKTNLDQKIIDKLCDTISPKTMLNYTAPLRLTFDYACENHIIKDNVLSKFIFKQSKKLKKQNEGKPFTNEELELIFNTEIHTKKIFDKAYKFWIPVILLYTGARSNDICNLKITDLIYFDDIPCIKIESSKTEAGKRIVPLHSKIIDIGFLNYVATQKAKNVEFIFNELKEIKSPTGRIISRGNTVGKWFNQKNERDTHVGLLNKCGVTGKGKKLHSFRNTFINHLKQKRIQVEEVKEIVGHVSDDMTFATYAEPYKVKVLKEIVEEIDYRGISLPWLSNKHYKKLPFPWET